MYSQRSSNQIGQDGFALKIMKTLWSRHGAAEGPERGLIYAVDDNRGLTELYTVLLKARGYLVRTFNQREQALAALAQERIKPDLLVTDCLGHSLPVERFLDESQRAHPPLRILMASGMNPGQLRFNDAKPVRFIQKPFTAEEFLWEVKRAIGTRPPVQDPTTSYLAE